jgi:hypothetical protein
MLKKPQNQHKDQTVEAAPYKIPGEDIITNTNLNTLRKQLTLIVLDTPQVSNNHLTLTSQINTIQNNQRAHSQTSDEDAFRE